MTPINSWADYQADRERILNEFEAVKPHTSDAWNVWHTVRSQALADSRRRFLANSDGYERLLISYRDAVSVNDYLTSPKAERLAA